VGIKATLCWQNAASYKIKKVSLTNTRSSQRAPTFKKSRIWVEKNGLPLPFSVLYHTTLLDYRTIKAGNTIRWWLPDHESFFHGFKSGQNAFAILMCVMCANPGRL